MDGKFRKYNGQVEINDMIGDAINNALARREQAINSEYALLVVYDDEAASVAGGQIAILGKILGRVFG